jgi:hypothetical protein
MIKARFFNVPLVVHGHDVPYVQADERGMLQGPVYFCNIILNGTILGEDICVISKLGEWHDSKFSG